MANRVYVVILNWNGWRETIECLESVMGSRGCTFRVIVCDNDSTDDSLARIAAWAEGRLVVDSARTPESLRRLIEPPQAKPIGLRILTEAEAEAGSALDDPPLTLIRNDANHGFAGGNNVGMRFALAHSDCAWVWVLNNDTVVAPDAMRALVERVGADLRIGLCGSTVLYYDAPSTVQALGGAYLNRWFGVTRHLHDGERWAGPSDPSSIEPAMSYVFGASMLATRAFVAQVGLMAEDYFLYYEELDWAMRARGRFALGYAPSSIVWHKEGASIGSSSKAAERSALCDYYGARNRLLFMRRFFPWRMASVYAGLLLSILKRLKRGQPDRARELFRIMLAPQGYAPHVGDPGLRRFRGPSKNGPLKS